MPSLHPRHARTDKARHAGGARSDRSSDAGAASRWERLPVLEFAVLSAVVAIGLASSKAMAAETEMLDVEVDELTFGFIKLTDMAPLADRSYEKGYFAEEGLNVTLEAAGQLEGPPRRRHRWSARRCAHARRPAARCVDRLRHARGPPRSPRSQHGPERQRASPCQQRRCGTEIEARTCRRCDDGLPVHPISAVGIEAPSGDRRASPAAGEPVQHGHGLPGLHAQLRAALLARCRRHQPGLLLVG